MRACLLVLLLAGAALGAPHEVVFRVVPDDASIYRRAENLELSYLGPAGRPVRLDLPERGFVDLVIRREGWRDFEKLERGVELGQLKTYPVSLEPLNRWVWLAYHFRRTAPWAGTLIALGLLVHLRWLRPRRLAHRLALERAERIAELQARARDLGSESLVGKLLGRYRVVEVVGRGGTATVYRAVPDATLDASEAVALKVLHPDMARDEPLRQRFLREAHAYRKLRHPNIVLLEDWGEQEGLFYLVMELVEGESLAQRLEGPMDPGQAAGFLELVMKAVEFAHSQGVVHRDLKPENVMLGADGVLKVMDFGLARVHEYQTVTLTGMIAGTPAYMAPEQIQSMGDQPSIDQYALGVMSYEMLTGVLPFQAADAVGLLSLHLNREPAPLRDHRPELSPEIERVVLRMMSKSPRDRFSGLGEAREALLRALKAR